MVSWQYSFCAAAAWSVENQVLFYKVRYREWFALRQILAGNIITCLEPLLICQCNFKFWCWERIFFDAGMARQQVCKQSMDDTSEGNVQSPIPASFYTIECNCSVRDVGLCIFTFEDLHWFLWTDSRTEIEHSPQLCSTSLTAVKFLSQGIWV